MNPKLALATPACALLIFVAGCGSTTANPIGEGGSSSTSTQSSDGGGGAATTTSSGTTTNSTTIAGECTPACSDSEVCVDASCHAITVLDTSSTLTGNPCNIVLDATNVYWQTGEVRRVAKAGGDAQSFAWTGSPSGLAVDDEYLYWSGTSNGIHRANKLAVKPSGQVNGPPITDQTGSPTYMTSDGSRLYFLDGTDVFETDTTLAIPTTKLFSPNGVAIGTIAVDATSLYYYGESSYQLARVDKATHAATALAANGVGFDLNIGGSSAIVPDGDTLFYSTTPVPGTGGIVAKVSTAGGASTVVVGSDEGSSGVFAIDVTNVWFMTPEGVKRVAKTGGASTLVSPLDPPSPFATCMAVDATHVYYVDGITLKKYAK